MVEKSFKNFEEQIEHLKSKNLKFKDEKRALSILKRLNYYALINGYKPIFLDEKFDRYLENTFFEDIYALYSFDAEMRELLLKFIFKFENNLKTKIIYYFSEKFKNDTQAYLKENNFDYENELFREKIEKLIKKMKKIIEKQKDNNDSRITHYLNKYNIIPIWVALPQFDLGIAVHFYKYSLKEIKDKISKHFYEDYLENNCNNSGKYILTSENFSSIISFVNNFRNVSAHNARLYNHKYVEEEIEGSIIHSRLNIEFKYKIFDLILILKSFLDKNLCENEKLNEDLEKLMLKLHKDLGEERYLKVLKEMEFPQNWLEIFRNY